jgi:putative hemolysin
LHYLFEEEAIMIRDDFADTALWRGRFMVKLAVETGEIEEALRLRFEVFNMELNAGLAGSYATGMDKDIYDDYCDHLIVMDTQNDMVVGTYRLLPGKVAENSVGYYSETEFDISAIKALPGAKLELGRSCVHKNFRNAHIINLLWKGIASYVDKYDVRHLFGCGSIHSTNSARISLVYSYLNRFHRTDERLSVHPIRILNDVRMLPFCDREQAFSLMPPLMKGYLRIGAQICGEPAYDPVFGSTDFLILLDTERLLKRYRRRFFREAPEHTCVA